MASSNNKRILKNTLFLYIRMIVVMGVTLFTSRLILKALGAEDFGIYNVVGGVVTMLMFLNSTLSSTCQRYFSSALGRNDEEDIKRLFCIIMTLYVAFLGVVLVIGETIGLWFVNNKLVVPENRVYAMNWVYQFTLLTVISNSITIPYRSLVISYEKMSFFAYVSIIEVVLKLLLVYILFFITIDKLIVYAFLMFSVHALIGLCYYIYCRSKYRYATFHLMWDRKMLAEIGSYSGWHLFGAMSVIIRNQGVNILLNTFFNPVVNAARAISYQVMTAVDALTNNFFTAVKPQIYKLHAANDHLQLNSLLSRSSKICFLLVGVLAFPILFNLQQILSFWLGEYPEHTVMFTELTLILALVDSLNGPSNAAALASNRIKWFEIITSLIMIANLPISYLFLYLGFNPEVTMSISIALSILSIFVRGYIVQVLIGYKLSTLVYDVIIPTLLTSVITYVVLYYVSPLISNNSLTLTIIRMIFFAILFIIVCICFLLNKTERNAIMKYIHKK